MILIFDSYGGLCNQFYDIQCAINFCLINQISFTFRYASFRNVNLTSWYNVPFSFLFDTSFLSNYSFYIPFHLIENQLNPQNTFYYENNQCCNTFLSNEKEDLIQQLRFLNKEFIILKQFWSVYLFKNIVEDIHPFLRPSSKIMNKYNDIKNELYLDNYNYNFIHYRYEHDFIDHFQITYIKPLIDIVKENPFESKDLRIYIATSQLEKFMENDIQFLNQNIVYKKENTLEEWNFEEKAFIDYMIGLFSKEVIGHYNSSFSRMLNGLKLTSHYYN